MAFLFVVSLTAVAVEAHGGFGMTAATSTQTSHPAMAATASNTDGIASAHTIPVGWGGLGHGIIYI